jgi:hypothetical protein
MNSPVSLQHLEYMETSTELFRRLLQAGYSLEAPACVITWGQVGAVLAETLVDHGLPPDRLDDTLLLELIQSVQQIDLSCWNEWMRSQISAAPGLVALLDLTGLMVSS